jgi:hypothetical protein
MSRVEGNHFMFFSPWVIVPATLFAILIILFAAFIIWLVHTLEGYPMFLIRNREREIGVDPLLLGDQSEPESVSMLATFTSGSQVRSGSRHEATLDHARPSDADHLRVLSNILANAQRGRDREAPARSIVLLTFEIEHE